MKHWALPGLLIALLAPLPEAGARAEVRVERVSYHGWPEAYRLSNGTVDLVVVPEIGRIMRYGYLGRPNVLWENAGLRGKTLDPARPSPEWVNFGGDKLWPAPQSAYWPPDPHLDGAPQSVTIVSGTRLRMESPRSAKLGIRFVRVIALADSGTGVRIRNTVVNDSRDEVEVSVWEVTQIGEPAWAALDLYRRGRFPRGYHVFPDSAPAAGAVAVRRGEVRLRRDPKQGGKIGADSPRGQARARVGGVVFTVSAPLERGAPYPDQGCAQEIWSNPDPLRYMELELLGPIVRLRPGAARTLETRWRLERARD